MGKGATRKPLEPWQMEDAARLKKLFADRAEVSQEKFGSDHGIGTQGAVYQYLAGKIPLNLRVALKFAKGLGVDLDKISPRLATELGGAREPVAQYALGRSTLLQDFDNLPPGLQEHIARKTTELRAYADSLPSFLRDVMKPPKDPEAYRKWEREIEADMAKRRRQDENLAQQETRLKVRPNRESPTASERKLKK